MAGVSAVRGAVLAAVALAALGCEPGGDAPLPPGTPATRPPDGLLGDPALQAVVERQAERDGAALVARLRDERAPVRARAALALGSVQAADAVPELEAALSDPDPSVRRDAAFALGQTGVADAAGALRGALASEDDPSARRESFRALGKLAGAASLDALLASDARSGESATRALALARLGAVGGVTSDASVELLAELLTDADAGVRLGAAYYFGRAPGTAPWARFAERVRAALRGYDRTDPAAMYLAQGLGRLGDAADAALLAGWAADGADWRTRVNAVAALGGLALDDALLPALVDRLDDSSAHVARAAAQVLSSRRLDPPLVRRVVAWVGAHPDAWQVAEPLMPGLAGAGEREAVLGWVDGLDAEDPFATAAGLRALAALPGTDVFERLQTAATGASARTADDALRALGLRWRGERVDERRRAAYLRVFGSALGRADVGAPSVAADALADSVFEGAGVAILGQVWGTLRLPDDARRMRAVLGALGASGHPDAESLLVDATASEDEGVRSAAGDALSVWRGETPAEAPPAARPTPRPLAPEARLDWAALAALGAQPRLVLETTRGRVVVRLDAEGAPQTVQTIARFAEEGRYDGVAFHRVVDNFVIQGGDFARGDGSGGPGFAIRSELNESTFERGTIGMASSGKDTEGSQFFINHVMTPHLDGGYTTFGIVVEGMDVVDRILVGDRVVRATVQHGR